MLRNFWILFKFTGRGEQGNNVIDVMTINVITKNSHSFHGDIPWMAKDATKTGYDCNGGKSKIKKRHNLKPFMKLHFGWINLK